MKKIHCSSKAICFLPIFFPGFSYCNGAAEDDTSKDKLVMALSPKSVEFLKRHLHKLGMPNYESKYVVLKNQMSLDDGYIYEPILGERVVFRLKGFVKTELGVAGHGRVSSLTGEIRDDHYYPSLPLSNIDIEKGKNEVSNVLDSTSSHLPTRSAMAGILPHKMVWQGKLPSITIGGEKFPAIRAQLSTLPWTNQIVLEGSLCSSKYLDEAGNCTFDRKSVMSSTDADDQRRDVIGGPAAIEPSTAAPESPSDLSDPVEKSLTSHPDEEPDECPVCRYMKGGPCKAEFLAWDKCMSAVMETAEKDMKACFLETAGMMRCMRKHEYYDMMTAGTEDSSYNGAISEAGKENSDADS